MEFLLFTPNKLKSTLTKWQQEAELVDLFPLEVERRLSWVDESLVKANLPESNKTIAYGVFQTNQDVAICTCELVLSDRGQLADKWLKMLKITLSPQIECLVQLENTAAIQTVVQAYKTATLGAFNARLENDAEVLKLYARSEGQLNLHSALLTSLQENDSCITVSTEGRWLVLKTIKEYS